MNRLSTAHRARIVAALVEGSSIHATARMCDVSVDLGSVHAACHDATIRDLTCKLLICDEICSFCHSMQKNVAPEHEGIFGRVHQSLKKTPAMAAGLAHRPWTVLEIAGLLDQAKDPLTWDALSAMERKAAREGDAAQPAHLVIDVAGRAGAVRHWSILTIRKERVMALPATVDRYVRAAMQRAFVERVDGAFAATVPEAFGVVAFGATHPECLADLRVRLEDWVCVSRSNGFALPTMHGIDLNSAEDLRPSPSNDDHPRAASRRVFENEREFEAALKRGSKRSRQAG